MAYQFDFPYKWGNSGLVIVYLPDRELEVTQEVFDTATSKYSKEEALAVLLGQKEEVPVEDTNLVNRDRGTESTEHDNLVNPGQD